MTGKQRLGRPRDADSTLTRARILVGARRLFADRGFEATSNRLIAQEAGLTTGAIYHYFDRKLDIFTAVHSETQALVYGRFEAAIAGVDTFVGRIEAVLEAAHDLNNDDPSLARFLGACRVDAARHPEVAAALSESGGGHRARFWDDLIEVGVGTGEIDPAMRATIDAVIQTVMTGLVDGVSGNRVRHRQAIDGLLALLSGHLIAPPAQRSVRVLGHT